jgi:aerobic carbon-monoxide dehydrogenase medium subunit
MIPGQFNYIAPDSLQEAVQLLSQNVGASILAGGQSLITDIKLRRMAPSLLVDLRKLQTLCGIGGRESNGALRIGAMTTCAEIAASEEVRKNYHALAEAALSIGDPQVRNCSTIGGNLAYNHPAADLPAVALVFEATINIVGPDGTRAIPANELIAEPFKTRLAPSEIITSVDFPAHVARAGSAYEKFKHPASGYAICGIAAMVGPVANGAVGKCRVAITGAASRATRLRAVENALEGHEPTAGNIAAAAGRALGEELSFTTDLFASAAYRAHLTQVLIERAMTRAVERAGLH